MEPQPKKSLSTCPPASSVFSLNPETGKLDADALAHYETHGYIVLRQVISGDEAGEVRKELHRIIDEWYDEFERTGVEEADWVSMVNREESARRGEMTVETKDQRYLSVRRLFRMAVHDPYFKAMSTEHTVLRAVVKQVLGKDVKLLQSMALLKPPGAAEKRWHQDNGYFRLTPNNLMAFWIAIDHTTVQNGCMHVVPGTHRHGVDEHKSLDGNHKLYSLVQTPDTEKVVGIPLQPGDALVFHGELHHFTPPNRSDGPRYAVQFHYASAECCPTVCPKAADAAATPTTDNSGPNRQDGTPSNDGTATGGDVMDDERGIGGGGVEAPAADRGFDCDPKCVEPQFWYFRKAECLVSGQDYGDPHI